ncbi:glycosyl hydrolase [Leptospira perolatii]|uniref:Glycosyl hydrolase n=1 Tax=Leptospira perolatii TaxID=2023191 RepID=A0A2M9ZIB0_9LEPT|nr:putative glycoside hydrolase [Leptospira perolatii]PJZ68035.1 glycosyl hydrolase [Leptospira perolatii]PJZ71693.1 glycosyl hydrolase [Leptospira perolatii]
MAEFTLPFPENSKKKTAPELNSRSSNKEIKSKPKDSSIAAEESQRQNRTVNRIERTEIEPVRSAPESLAEESETSRPPRKKILGEDSIFPPKFYRGIYISNSTFNGSNQKKKKDKILAQASEVGINVLVIDVQSKVPTSEEVKRIKEMGFYPVARVVNFDGGLPTEFPSKTRMESILSYVRRACEAGFAEIQLDYIRYADDPEIKLTLKKKYSNLHSIISRIRNEANQCDDLPYLGADIFGRIPFNKDDLIGQKVENFAQLVDVIYPMLYPSHFYGQPSRISNPYQTVYDGLVNTKKRSLPTTRVVGYIQGFNMKVAQSRKSMKDYIKAQIEASVDSDSNGFVVWNAWNDYAETFKAIRESISEKKLEIAD